MANIDNNSEKNDEQSSQFAKNQKLKADVYDAIEEQLIKSTEAAFKSEGIKTREPKDSKEQQGWNRGVYGDGSTYGTGVAKGQDTITVNRVKGPKSTNGFFEKNLSYGGKKMVVEIHVDIDAESKTMDFTYQTTEQAAFRGHQDKKTGAYMINDKQSFKVDSLSEFKKDIKKVLDKFAEKEAAYFINTKLGIEDRTEKSINSMVENNMKKLSLTDIIKGNFEETIEKIMESTKKKEVEKNHPEVKSANTKGKLLFDDLEEAEKKNGKDYRNYFEKKMKEFGASNPKELKQSEWKTIDMGWESEKENSLDEVTTSGAAGGSAIQANPFAPQKRDFNETEYSKKDKKRVLKRENKNGWTEVELEPGSGYVPKGMNKNYALGLHGVDVNSKKEDNLSTGRPKGKGAMNEGLDTSKKKFISESEHEEKGINKRYIITHKKTASEESERWKNLSSFEKNSTIKIAESCGCPVEDGIKEKMVSREDGEKSNEKEFMKRNSNVDHGDSIDGKKVVVVSKPGSLSNATFKVFEDEYLNENKSFILDLNSGNLVNNPNYKLPVIEKNVDPLNESIVEIKKEAKPLNESSAYIFNVETGQLIRNKNYNPNK